MTRRTFTLELADEGNPTLDTPTDVRLRHVLKGLLRQYRLRCQSIVETTDQGPAAGEHDPAGDDPQGRAV